MNESIFFNIKSSLLFFQMADPWVLTSPWNSKFFLPSSIWLAEKVFLAKAWSTSKHLLDAFHTHISPTFDFFVEELIQTQYFFSLSIIWRYYYLQSNSRRDKSDIYPTPTSPSISEAFKKGQLFPNSQSLFGLKCWLYTYYIQGILLLGIHAVGIWDEKWLKLAQNQNVTLICALF